MEKDEEEQEEKVEEEAEKVVEEEAEKVVEEEERGRGIYIYQVRRGE